MIFPLLRSPAVAAVRRSVAVVPAANPGSLFRSVLTALTVFAACITATAAENAPVASDASNPHIREAYAAHEAGETDAALAAFRKALEQNGNDVAALLGTAMIYAEKAQHREAFTSYDAVVRRVPENIYAWSGRGLAAFNMEDFDEALSSFEKATARKPVNGFFYESLAWTRMCRGEFAQAAESAKEAALMYNRAGERSVYPLLIAYFSYLESGDTENAQRTLRYAVKNKPITRWPAPVVDYLNQKIEANDLISFVTNSAEETEAHTYIGLNLRLGDQPKQAARHLDWVRKHGDPRVFEYTLARSLNLRNSVATAAR